jgi:hypothetical protein
MIEINAVEPKSSAMEYYGWSWIGVKVVRLYFENMTIETVTLLLFLRFGISRTWTHRFVR